jgi:glycosyltransferase involved in cell wall biosynthesis
MVIAICIRVLSGDDAASKILIQWFENIAAENKQHQFYFISNDNIPTSSLQNVQSVVIKQQSYSPLLWKFWYNYKLPFVLKKIKANLLISADGICSLRIKVPQCLIVPDTHFLKHAEWYSSRYAGFIKSNIPLYLKKAIGILTFSDVVKNELVQSFAIEEHKVIVSSPVYNKNYKALSWNEKNIIKNKYTEGNEYFIFCGSVDKKYNLTNLLKAFSLFKKRQKSSMQLVLLTNKIPAKNDFVESLRLYKYRNEVKLLENLPEDEVISLTASAWCAINLSPFYSDIHFLQKALCFEVPVITCNTKQSKELLKEAALFATAANIDSIAEQLMLIYKDEKKQNELVENGKKLVIQLNKNSFTKQIGMLINSISDR